jgi:hypothetical protein
MYLLNWMNGIKRSYLYELLDDSDQSGPEAAFGLIRSDGSQKPAYFALKNLMALLGNQSAVISPLNYTLSGPNVTQLLVQQTNGSWLLILWQEVSCYDLQARKEIVNQPVSVDIILPSVMTAKVYRPLLQAEALECHQGAKLTVQVTDHVTVIQLQ